MTINSQSTMKSVGEVNRTVKKIIAFGIVTIMCLSAFGIVTPTSVKAVETINETNNFEIIQNFISVQPLFILIFSSHILLKSPHGDEAEQIDTR